ncbi:sugar phosphate nucleotidyltransferase [Povalibacter sp.]|uniref:sugar phosphate nucleotidyltransferase n=1 Tax=Povalibacter sp. TaxID=1962978 RepID=UPI002F3F21E5
MTIELGYPSVRVRRRLASRSARKTWALVLAGGEGTRLRQLTIDAKGISVPKQFCSLSGGQTLLSAAIARAKHVAAPERTCSIVSETHRQWWASVLADEPPENVIVQPRGRGTGIGILYAALHIAARDPDARIVVLPADHYVQSEPVLQRALRSAVRQLRRRSAPVLMGIEPTAADSELGYIVPGPPDDRGMLTVSRFVEKPDPLTAQHIIGQGALWNMLIIAASVRSLVKLFAERFSVVSLEMQAIVNAALHAEPPHSGWPAIVEMYDRLPQIDFSRDILQQQPQDLRVLQIADCGWSDLGTPSHVAATLQCLPAHVHRSDHVTPFVNLAQQHAQYEHRDGPVAKVH